MMYYGSYHYSTINFSIKTEIEKLNNINNCNCFLGFHKRITMVFWNKN